MNAARGPGHRLAALLLLPLVATITLVIWLGGAAAMENFGWHSSEPPSVRRPTDSPDSSASVSAEVAPSTEVGVRKSVEFVQSGHLEVTLVLAQGGQPSPGAWVDVRWENGSGREVLQVGSDGRAMLEVPSGWADVSAFQGQSRTVWIAAGKLTALKLELQADEVAEGRVQTADGRGVDAAEILVSADQNPRWSRVLGKSGADGRFSVRLPRSLVRFVAARKSGVGVAPFLLWSGSSLPDPAILVLEPRGRLGVRVTDVQGSGVPRLLVTIGDDVSVSSHSERQGGVRTSHYVDLGRTLPDGTIEFVNVPIGRVPWSLIGDGWASMRGSTMVLPEGSELKIVARATPRLHGVIWCHDKQIESAGAALVFKQGEHEVVHYAELNKRFDLDGLPLGTVKAEALVRTGGSVWRATGSLELFEGQIAEWSPVISRVRAWSGLVHDELGRGLAGWRVSVRDADGKMADARTGVDGRWTIDQASDSFVEIGIFAPVGDGLFERLPRVTSLRQFEQSSPELALSVTQADSSCGSLSWRSSEGAPVSAWLESGVSWLGSNMLAGIESGDVWLIDRLPPGEYRMVAHCEGDRWVMSVSIRSGERVSLGTLCKNADGSAGCQFGQFTRDRR